MFVLATARPRSPCTKRNITDMLNEDISQDRAFIIDTHMDHWMWVALTCAQFPRITQKYNKEMFCLHHWTSITSGIQLHSPGKRRLKGHKQVDILCPMNWKKKQLVELEHHYISCWLFDWQHWWTDQWQVHWVGVNTRLALPQDSDTLLQVLSGATASEWDWDLGNSRTLHSSKHSVKIQRPCVRMQLKYQETSFIADNILQNCTYSCQSDVCSEDIQNGLGQTRTVVTKGTHLLCTVVYRQDTL